MDSVGGTVAKSLARYGRGEKTRQGAQGVIRFSSVLLRAVLSISEVKAPALCIVLSRRELSLGKTNRGYHWLSCSVRRYAVSCLRLLL